MSASRMIFAAGGWTLALEVAAIEAVRERHLVTPLPGTQAPVRGLAVVDGATRVVLDAALLVAAVEGQADPAGSPPLVADLAGLWILLAAPATGVILEIPSPIAFLAPGPRAPRPDNLAGICHRAESDPGGGVLALLSPARLLTALRRAGGPLWAHDFPHGLAPGQP